VTQLSRSQHTLRSNIVFTFILAAAIYVAWLVRDVLVLLYVSALFAVVLTPVVRATGRLRIGRWLPFQGSAAILFLLVIVAAALTAFGFLAFPPVIRDLQSFSSEVPARVPALLDKAQRIPFVGDLDPTAIASKIQDYMSHVATYLLLSIRNWASTLADIVTGFVLTVYFILEGDHAYRWFLSFLSPQPRKRLDDTLQRAAIRMEKWLLGQASLMLILGIASTIVYRSLDLRYAYALGVLTGMLNVIPVLGAAVSFVLALFVAAIDSWGRVLGVAIFYLVYLQIENSYLTPRIMRNRVNLPALAIFVALLLGSALEGVLGALVAIPTAVLVSVLLDEYLVRKDEA
jgi:predicted PurR-regulated permease PerM